MGNKLMVQKMLGAEEISLIEDLQSTISELLSLAQAGAGEGAEQGGGGEVDVMSALKKLISKETPEEQAGAEDEIEKSDDGPTGNDSADVRTDPSTDVNDENISEVGKALVKIMKSMKTEPVAQRRVEPQGESLVKALTAVMAPLVSKISEIEKFNSNIVDALGVTKSVEETAIQNQSVQKSGNVPVQSYDATAVVKELIDVIKGNQKAGKVQEPYSPVGDHNGLQTARKSMKEALPFIFSNALNNKK